MVEFKDQEISQLQLKMKQSFNASSQLEIKHNVLLEQYRVEKSELKTNISKLEAGLQESKNIELEQFKLFCEDMTSIMANLKINDQRKPRLSHEEKTDLRSHVVALDRTISEDTEKLNTLLNQCDSSSDYECTRSKPQEYSTSLQSNTNQNTSYLSNQNSVDFTEDENKLEEPVEKERNDMITNLSISEETEECLDETMNCVSHHFLDMSLYEPSEDHNPQKGSSDLNIQDIARNFVLYQCSEGASRAAKVLID